MKLAFGILFGSDSSHLNHRWLHSDPDVLSDYKVWWQQLLQLGTRRYHSYRDESKGLSQLASERHRLIMYKTSIIPKY